MDLKTLQQLQTEIESLFSLLSISSIEPTVEIDRDEILKVDLKTSDGESNSGLLIGSHGETLAALEYLLALMVNRDREEWLRIQVDIDGYREKRIESLTEAAHQAADKALGSGSPVPLYPMLNYERRIIHTALADKPGVTTESAGTGRQRHVVVKPA